MAIKKSELYSSLWKSCDELRGGMDASQYKDYVLVMLFMKYVSDKFAGKKDAVIIVPEGATFQDMVNLKGKTDIGDRLNKLIGKLAKANHLTGIIDTANFNDEEKLGKGKAMRDRLSKLIAIFQDPGLDFSKNRASDDDILGDAYEYLMRHFATESGKSKGQFYTPAEVSRVLAKIININRARRRSKTLYDPTCGSGSLLLKAADETPRGITIYGQEKDVATRGLSVMNMWLHGEPTAVIKQGDTISNPLFKGRGNMGLKRFDFVVANPPFSYKSWSSGIDPVNDEFERFTGYGIPPAKNGDYAFLLHIIKSLKSTGKGACILPHGVLFRGNVEAKIRKNIVKRGYIKGIIGLPPNLFYGTGIPACIVMIDKENAEARKGIFMIDASKGFVKDGNKNRLREQDIRKIVDVFNQQIEVDKFSRMVPVSEISSEKNDYNLNIPRYIDSQEEEDIQDIEAHLKGGIPQRDIDALENYWKVYPSISSVLFEKSDREGYLELKVESNEIKETIYNHQEFIDYSERLQDAFSGWKDEVVQDLRDMEAGVKPKEVIGNISDEILRAYSDSSLIDKYDIYQNLMDYWNETMQDDLYEIAQDGWEAGKEVIRRMRKGKRRGKTVKKKVKGIEGLEGRLIPPELLIDIYFTDKKKAIEELESKIDTINSQIDELTEEHSGEGGILEEVKSDSGNITKGNIKSKAYEIRQMVLKNPNYSDELKEKIKVIMKTNFYNIEWETGIEDQEGFFADVDVLYNYTQMTDKCSQISDDIKETLADLEKKVIQKYPELEIDEIKEIVADKKWVRSIEDMVNKETDRISQRLTGRIKELSERYETPLPEQAGRVAELEETVNGHLMRMGYSW